MGKEITLIEIKLNENCSIIKDNETGLIKIIEKSNADIKKRDLLNPETTPKTKENSIQRTYTISYDTISKLEEMRVYFFKGLKKNDIVEYAINKLYDEIKGI